MKNYLIIFTSFILVNFIVLEPAYADNSKSITPNQLFSNEAVEQSSPIFLNYNTILKSVSNLESIRDPKCHATATRLESLIYGTKLSKHARYKKNELQKQFIKALWLDASELTPENEMEVTNKAINEALTKRYILSKHGTGINTSWDLKFTDRLVTIAERDLEHYGSIAFSLRALLAVQQEQLFEDEINYKALTTNSVERIKEVTDFFTLALLQHADNAARKNNQYEITAELLLNAGKQLLPDLENKKNVVKKTSSTLSNKGILTQIVNQKLASYKTYNGINNQLFSRNLQVYFALAKLPKSGKDKKEFTQAFTESMVSFANSLYQQSNSLSEGQPVINESAVQIALSTLLPQSVNAYEDVVFFPNYPINKQVTIESYDMDAFRDTGLHWLYFSYALNDLKTKKIKEADPFAAELLAEGIAHFGVLLLRETGSIVRNKVDADEVRLSASAISESFLGLIDRVNIYHRYSPPPLVKEKVHSANKQRELAENYFTQIDQDYGINISHRSSDWLSRQMRSYLKSSDSSGNITIPPAFGGSGVAAEDFDGDGRIDLLILSGAGNKLYRNTEKGFIDVTKIAGLVWNRASDQQPGEPRQPLIADIDNDGHQDIIITYVNDKHRVYRNKGNGRFEDVTELSRLGGKGLVGGPATIVDVNNDGLLDVYIAYFGNYLQNVLPTLKRKNSNGTKNELFINKGNFVFEKQVTALGADNVGWGQALTHTDINQDGWQDLIVGNDFGVNSYYINKQGKGFVDMAEELGTDKPSYTMNVSLSDLNRDGLPDIYVSNIVTMNKDEKYVLPSKDTGAKFNPDKLANMRVVEGNDLFISSLRNKAIKYQLSDKVGRGYSSTGWAWDADFWDVDNDGDDDLYVLNGMNDYFVYSTKNNYHEFDNELIFPDASKASNVFFINSSGALNNQSEVSGLDVIANSRSATYFDLEGDGDLDVLVNNYHDKAMLFRNNSEKLKNNWMTIHLKGDPSNGVNLDAIGAQILAGFAEDGYAWRQISGSQGYLSVHPKIQHLGLGKSIKARIMVIWPNGERESFGELAANKNYQLTYGLKK